MCNLGWEDSREYCLGCRVVIIAILSYGTSGWVTFYGTGTVKGRGEEPAENVLEMPQPMKNSFEMGMQEHVRQMLL